MKILGTVFLLTEIKDTFFFIGFNIQKGGRDETR